MFSCAADTFALSRDGPMLTSFNLFEIVFRPMVNKGIARGVSAIPNGFRV
ncbi:hypothetical protein WCP94_000132 (plasmid) [Bilophila wadsworthia]